MTQKATQLLVTLSWYRINSTGESDSARRRFDQREAAGSRAYSISWMSPWERRRIKEWAKRHDADLWSRQHIGLESDGPTQLMGCCATFWVPNAVSEETLDEFLTSLPKRQYGWPLTRMDDATRHGRLRDFIRRYVRHNYWTILGADDWDIGFQIPAYLSLSDAHEHFMFRMYWDWG